MVKKAGQIGVILCALIAAMSILAFTGCKKDALKGATIVYANWWADYNVDTFEPRNDGEQRQLDNRIKLQKENGFTMYEEQISGWDDYFQIITNYILSGNKNYSAYQVGADWAMSLYKQGLLAPLPTDKVKISGQEPIGEFKQTGYPAAMAQLMTFGGKQYALSFGEGNASWQNILILYNKRLLREGGVDPDQPYDLQAAGTWTWDALVDMLRRTTRDTNGDGVTDIYGLASDDDGDVLNAFIYSNNANTVVFDAAGNAINAMNRPEYIEAMQFFARLYELGYMMPKPADSQWAWNFFNFVDGKIAFFVGQEWYKGMAGDMQDDYGSVVMPKGPRAQNYRTSFTENVTVVPAIFSPEEVDAIIRALDLWMRPDETDWQAGHYWAYRDRRAVEETLPLTKRADLITYRNLMLVPGFYDIYKEFADEFRNTRSNPAQIIEQYAPRFNAAIDSFNR
jgi:ABC-type glycerol-3-phosphate transport system substrate-binding protein